MIRILADFFTSWMKVTGEFTDEKEGLVIWVGNCLFSMFSNGNTDGVTQLPNMRNLVDVSQKPPAPPRV